MDCQDQGHLAPWIAVCYLADGHRAVDKIIERVAIIRGDLGSSVDFGLDFHGRMLLPMATVLLRELEPFRPLFVEEPVMAEHAEQYSELSRGTSIVLAAGERAC